MRGTNGANYYSGDIWVLDLTTGSEWLVYTNPSYIVGYDWDLASPPHLILDNGCSFWSASPSNPPTVFPLANTCYSYAPVVNPVDGRIAYFNTTKNTGTTGYGPVGIAVASADGATVHPLTATAVNSEWPAWSPDGTRLAFCYLNNFYATNGQADLYTINADGMALAQISAFTSSADGFVHGAIWTPDGKWLVGAGSIGSTNGLWLIPLTPDAQQCDCPAHLLPTTPGDPIDFASSAIAAAAPTVAKPGLYISANDTNLVVTWSTNYQGFSL
jgi:WD40 repeat protein